MKRLFSLPLTFSVLAGFAAPFLAFAQTNNPSAAERFIKPSDVLTAAESRYWQRTPLPVPDAIVLEVSGIVAVAPARLLVATRRGEVWWIDGAYDANPKPRYTLFAEGLHEPLGIVAAPKGGFYVAQRQELTRLADTDGDGRADVFETVAKFPISGSYHEYAFGPVLAPNGNLRVTLNVAFGGATQAPVPWRGWITHPVSPDTAEPCNNASGCSGTSRRGGLRFSDESAVRGISWCWRRSGSTYFHGTASVVMPSSVSATVTTPSACPSALMSGSVE
jgi:hypothetical protein